LRLLILTYILKTMLANPYFQRLRVRARINRRRVTQTDLNAGTLQAKFGG